MSDIRARLKTETRDVWRFWIPPWVEACTEQRNDGLYLVRASGKQLIKRGEYLIRDLDGEPEWMTDAEFHLEYEVVK
jgi:hypothetical protein